MATTYNFTVRAEDNEGAFADRDFSIVVRNTAIDRYLYVDATDAYTSNDFINWTKRAGQGGFDVAYGGGMWLIQSGASSGIFRRTRDGVTFDSVNLTGPLDPSNNNEPVGGAFTPNAMPQFHNGYWWVISNQSSVSRVLRSSDGAVWTVHAITSGFSLGRSIFFQENSMLSGVSTTGSANYVEIPYEVAGENAIHNLVLKNSGAPNHGSTSSGSYGYVSPPVNVNGIYIRTIGYNGVAGRVEFSRTGTGNWTTAQVTATSGSMQSNAYDRIVYANGLFILPGVPTSTSGGGYRPVVSTDCRNWTQLNLTSAASVGTQVCAFTKNGTTYFLTGSAQLWSTVGTSGTVATITATDMFPTAPRAIAMAK